MRAFSYVHADVFTDTVLRGNGLAAVFCDRFFADDVMLDLAREFKQFETIFLSGFDGGSVQARIFTMEGELPFAGHPVLGAAAALHGREGAGQEEMRLLFRLPEKDVQIESIRTDKGYRAVMRQGAPVFIGTLPAEEAAWLARAHSLLPEDLDGSLPLEVVSTGLPYVLLPVRGCLERARVAVRDLEARIAGYGARYTYLFDPATLEARTWDNLGLVEDSATGSAAGPLCAYLARHGRVREKEVLTIRQGQYANRPSVLRAWMEAGEAYVAGDVAIFAEGRFVVP